MTIQQVISKAKEKNPRIDTEFIIRAYEFARRAHQGQKRISGEDYIEHPLESAYTVAQMNLDATTIAAAFLHDVIDDTPVTLNELEKEFGKEVAFLVAGVSKLGKMKYRGIESQVEDLRKFFLVMAEDIRVVLIKLADRLHNMQTLDVLPRRKQKRIALETLEIYAPLAYRLGIGEIKGRLEDLAFPYIYPKEYKWIIESTKGKYNQCQKHLQRVQEIIERELKYSGIKIIDIHRRTKHLYSLYKKLLRYEMDLEKIYDLVALRIIVEDIKDCYGALGIIHKIWRPLPGRIKDYIAIPKPNGYQSLHTTVFAENRITEIQIRTPKMHREAEEGIAAWWAYTDKKGTKEYIKKRVSKKTPEELNWVKQLSAWQREVTDSKKFLESLKIDFFQNRIFVFTPHGDVKNLPEGATPVDFAYVVHTEVGHSCIGAKADGKIVPLDSSLKNGQIVEIMTAKKIKGPNRNWLRFVKTHQAKSKIKAFLNKTDETEKGIKFKIRNVSKRIISLVRKKVPRQILHRGEPKIELAGQNGLLITIAKCCQPKAGDKIKGYITVGKGASIHRADCKNILKVKNKERIISASWK